MDPNDLLIFRERKEKAEQGKGEANAAAQPSQGTEPEAPLAELSKKVEAHEAQAKNEREKERAMKVSAKEEAKKRKEEEKLQIKTAKITFEQENKKKERNVATARQAVAGLNCVWHPWRQAYAICNYCHRAFCFEDIVEDRGNYYCIEDMDTAIKKKIEAESSRALNISVIAGGAFLVPMLIFIYAYNSALVDAISYVSAVGFVPFIYDPVYLYSFPLMGIAAVFLGLVIGLRLFMGDRRLFPNALAGLTLMALFAFNYFQTYNLYDFAIAATFAAALGMFAYSNSAYISQEEVAPVAPQEEPVPQWANVSRF